MNKNYTYHGFSHFHSSYISLTGRTSSSNSCRMNDSGMPWKLPLGVVFGVFRSAWASIHNTQAFSFTWQCPCTVPEDKITVCQYYVDIVEKSRQIKVAFHQVISHNKETEIYVLRSAERALSVASASVTCICGFGSSYIHFL